MNRLVSTMLVSTILIQGASASVITFENLPVGTCQNLPSSVITNGYAVTSTNQLFACDANGVANNSSRALLSANGRSDYNLVQAGGSTFSLSAFDAGTRYQPDFGYLPSIGIHVEGTLAQGGSVIVDFLFDGVNFSNFLLPASFTNLSSVTLSVLGPDGPRNSSEFLIDNVVVGSEVPEPSNLALFATALGVVSIVRRSKRLENADDFDSRLPDA